MKSRRRIAFPQAQNRPRSLGFNSGHEIRKLRPVKWGAMVVCAANIPSCVCRFDPSHPSHPLALAGYVRSSPIPNITWHKADDAISQKRSLALLFNHLVSLANQRQRHCHAERFGGRQIDKQLDFRDLLDRKIGRLLALENATGVVLTGRRLLRFRYTAY
jgi:hypothetical protein